MRALAISGSLRHDSHNGRLVDENIDEELREVVHTLLDESRPRAAVAAQHRYEMFPA